MGVKNSGGGKNYRSTFSGTSWQSGPPSTPDVMQMWVCVCGCEWLWTVDAGFRILAAGCRMLLMLPLHSEWQSDLTDWANCLRKGRTGVLLHSTSLYLFIFPSPPRLSTPHNTPFQCVFLLQLLRKILFLTQLSHFACNFCSKLKMLRYFFWSAIQRKARLVSARFGFVMHHVLHSGKS